MGAKMFSAHQITVLLKQLYLWNEMMKKPVFLLVDTDLLKLKVERKVLGWTWSKMGMATLILRL